MRRRTKKILKFLLWFVILSPVLYTLWVFTIMSIVRYEEIRAYEEGMRNPNPEWLIMKQKIDAQIEVETAHINAGSRYEEAGQYDLAIEEYKKAIEISRLPMKQLAYSGLVDVYEKTGQYDLAIESLNWCISHPPPNEAETTRDIDRKHRLEELLNLAGDKE